MSKNDKQEPYNEGLQRQPCIFSNERVKIRECPRCKIIHKIWQIANEINTIAEAENALAYYGEKDTEKYRKLDKVRWFLLHKMVGLIPKAASSQHLDEREVVVK